VVSLSIGEDGQPAAAWRRLPDIPFPVFNAAVVGHHLASVDTTYDLRTGRTAQIPQELRTPRVRRAEAGTQRYTVPDALLLGDWFSIGDGLYNPDTGEHVPVPANKGTGRPTSTYPYGRDADYRVDEEACQWIGGPENLVELCDPPKRHFSPGNPIAGSYDQPGPGITEVLRVADGSSG
jgi:hypothetical protein